MDFAVIFSPAALDDLEQIVTHVAQNSSVEAERLGHRLLDQAETLCRLPHRGGNVVQRPGVRKLILRPYIIFYRVNEAVRRVEVLRFWHGAQNPDQLHLQ